MARGEYVTLDGYIVKAATEKAIGLCKEGDDSGDLIWLPRSTCQDGDDITRGDEDVCVIEWKADQMGLDY